MDYFLEWVVRVDVLVSKNVKKIIQKMADAFCHTLKTSMLPKNLYPILKQFVALQVQQNWWILLAVETYVGEDEYVHNFFYRTFSERDVLAVVAFHDDAPCLQSMLKWTTRSRPVRERGQIYHPSKHLFLYMIYCSSTAPLSKMMRILSRYIILALTVCILQNACNDMV